MVSLKYAKQVFFLSATFDTFAAAYLLKCFNVPNVQNFLSAPEIVDKITEDDIIKSSFSLKSESLLLAKL